MLETIGTPQVEEYPYPLPEYRLNGSPEWEPWEEREPITHEHVCTDCEQVFWCEGQCELGNRQLCEDCEIAGKRASAGNGPVTAFNLLIRK